MSEMSVRLAIAMSMISRRAAAPARRVYAQAYASTSTAPASSAGPLPEAPAAPRRRRAAREDTGDVDLVAPPDPHSNIRPVLYAASRRRRPSNSPYSAAEFPAEAAGSGAGARAAELEMAWTMHRERVDMANHRFWALNNADFEAQRELRLARLPPDADEAAREAVLSQFYRDWQIGTRTRQEAWVRNWWSDVWTGLKLQTRVYYWRWRAGSR